MWALVGAALGAALAWAGTRLSVRWTSVPRRRGWEYALAVAVGGLVGGLLPGRLGGLSPAFFLYLLLAAVLITASVVDLHDFIIPNELMAFAAAAGVVLRLLAPVGPWWAPVAGAAFGFGLLLLLGLLYPGGMGMGDVKLAGVMGLYLGWPLVLVALLLAFVLGGAVSLALLTLGKVGRKDHIPFGPFLSAGGLAAALWGHDLIQWYLFRP